ncbi:FAD-binding oxidoreductase [Streptomyces sp. NPDC098781]|uniref:FAD-binding oxidoreductase n=1 Tax=Streptomyces sp. NPDC098781 TaxID=3366097 RepID=UPI00382CDB2D
MTATHRNTPDLFALSQIHGPVLHPGDDGYAGEVTGFNLAALHTPDVVVGATGADDIVTALRWATATGTPVAVQATGHGANFPIDHGLLINTSRMTDVHIDADRRVATVGAGAKWRHVLDAAAPHGLAPLCGSASGVGVVGYTLGGGLPVVGRAYGYATDLVRSFQVATPDGTLRVCDADHEPELFWALRGGKGNVGVVTSVTFDLLRLPTILGGGIYCPGEHAQALLTTWADWTRDAPAEMCTAFSLLRLPPIPQIPEPLRGGFWARVAVAYTGDATQGESLLRPLRSAAPVTVDTVEEMPYAALDRVFMEPQDPLPAREACTLLRELAPQALRTFLTQVGPDVPDCPLLSVEIRHLGGALSRPARVADAIPARDATYMLASIGVPAAPPQAEATERATASLHTAMTPYGTGHTLINIHGTPGDAPDRARAWTPDTYNRLRQTKSTYDPSNLLRFGHTVET